MPSKRPRIKLTMRRNIGIKSVASKRCHRTDLYQRETSVEQSYWLLKVLLKWQTSQILNLQAILGNIVDHSWCNDECQLAKKRQQKAWEIFYSYFSTTNCIIFKQSRANTRKTHWRKQKKSWIISVTIITFETRSKQLWHFIKEGSGNLSK